MTLYSDTGKLNGEAVCAGTFLRRLYNVVSFVLCLIRKRPWVYLSIAATTGFV